MEETTVHFLAGGLGGTIGAMVTCPLEVIKTRLQSSRYTQFQKDLQFDTHAFSNRTATSRISLIYCIRSVYMKEGVIGFFKGFGPNLLGVFPSRSVYFATYHAAQKHLMPHVSDKRSLRFIVTTAAIGGFVTASLTNPIWYVKTQLQLDNRSGDSVSKASTIIHQTWKQSGIFGFYRGIQASYMGISETAIHFFFYENLKGCFIDSTSTRRIYQIQSTISDVELLPEYRQLHRPSYRQSQLNKSSDAWLCVCASAISKTGATTICYPLEVARTRLRENHTKYRRLFQTLGIVFREEGRRGLYRGLLTHYLRQVPNSCIVIGIYEGTIFFLDKHNLIRIA